MRILVISQYFPPDITAAAYRIGDTCKLLKEWGHEVRVVTTTPHKGGVDEAKIGLLPEEIHRIEVMPLEKRTARAYIEQYLGFVVRAFFAAMRLRRTFDYDVVWATSPPLFMALCTIPLRLCARRPVVLDIRDLWPESAVNIGKVRRGSLMERVGKVLEWAAYRWSDRITCVSQPMRAYIEKRTKRPVSVVYNGAPRSQLGGATGPAPDPDVFCYAGNLGYAQGLDVMLDAFAAACRSPAMASARLRLVGTGAVEGDLRAQAEHLGILGRVDFLGVRPKREALELMSQSGALLIPLMDSPAFALTVPSKVFDYMGLGRPVIASIRGEGREILELTGANIVVDPGNPSALADAMVRTRTQWQSMMELAPANIALVSDRFSRESAVEELQRSLQAAIRSEGGRT
jgi:glycosyltransferase involved in cell wall biosynthesis